MIISFEKNNGLVYHKNDKLSACMSEVSNKDFLDNLESPENQVMYDVYTNLESIADCKYLILNYGISK